MKWRDWLFLPGLFIVGTLVQTLFAAKVILPIF